MSSDQANKEARKHLEVDDFVTTQQIKSLFSHWSRASKDASLKECDTQNEAWYF